MDLIVEKKYFFKDDKLFFKFLLNNTSRDKNGRIHKVEIEKDKIYKFIYLINDQKYDYTGRVYFIKKDSIYIDISSFNSSKKIKLFISNIFYCERKE